MASKKKTSGSGGGRPLQSVPALQSAIRDSGYQWAAGDTPLTALSAAEQKSRLGLSVDEQEMRATAKAIAAAEQMRAFTAVSAPASIDWRNNGGDWTTSVKDQGGCGSCVSFATCGTLESRINIVCRKPTLDVNLSEAHLFFCGCGNCCNTGWNFAPALDFCKNTGVGLDSSFPYTPSNQPCKSGVTPYVKITNWTAVLPVADRKNILATKGPMVAGMQVFQDFFAYRTGVYRHVTGSLAGLHAIGVVGYDDAQKCWICKNSWGTSWGESGFFRIGYGECAIDTSFAFYDMDVRCPDGQDDEDRCRRYVTLLTRVLIAARTNLALRRCLRFYVCGRPPRPVCSAAILEVVKAVILILRECPQYRQPFCRALG